MALYDEREQIGVGREVGLVGVGVVCGMLIMWGMQEVPPPTDTPCETTEVSEGEDGERVEAVCGTDTDCEEWEWRQEQERKWREAQRQKGERMRDEVEI